MAESEGARPFLPKSFIWDKWGPLPAWAWMSIALGGAVIIAVWRKNQETAAPTNDPTAAGVAGSLPYNATAPVVWKTDIFNQIPAPTVVPVPGPAQVVTIPNVPPGGGRTDPPVSIIQDPIYAEVKKDWHVSQFITDYRALPNSPAPGLTWEILEALNPGISSNVNWNKDPAKTTFKAPARYRVK